MPSSAGREQFDLRWRGEARVAFVVERTFTEVQREPSQDAQILAERAVLSYGATRTVDGRLQTTPTLTLLQRQNPGDVHAIYHLQTPKIQGRQIPTAALAATADRSGHRWWVRDILTLPEILPVLPEEPVEIGDSWQLTLPVWRSGTPFTIPVTIQCRLARVEPLGGHLCAVIEYSIGGELVTGDRPELLAGVTIEEDRKLYRAIKPVYAFSGQGVAHLDLERGFFIAKKQHIEHTEKWAGEVPMSMMFPGWQKKVDRSLTSDIRFEEISGDEAERLIAQAAETTAPAPAPAPESVELPVWQYSVKRTVETVNALAGTEEKSMRRAMAVYGEGEHRGGAVPGEPLVMDLERRPSGPAFNPFPGERFRLVGDVMQLIKPAPAWPAEQLGYAYDLLPLAPAEDLAVGSTWERELPLFFGNDPRLTFPAKLTQRVTGQEKRVGRECFRVAYDVSAKFDLADYADRVPAEDLREFKATFTVSGNGVVFIDTEDKMVIAKQQTIETARHEEKLGRADDGGLVWVPKTDERRKVRIDVELID
jgi:hypothetical protein